MTRAWDVANGDADGLCALHQLRLAEPLEATLVTGPKRDIELLARVDARHGDRVTVLDVSLDRNRAALARLLEHGARVLWFDHHYAGDVPAHALLEAHIDAAPSVCTSVIVDRWLGARHRAWAVTAAFGDNLPETATCLAAPLGLDPARLDELRELGEAINYNAYGESEADLLLAPATLYRRMSGYADPFEFLANEPFVRQISEQRRADLAQALALVPHASDDRHAVYLLPDEPWSRRVGGAFANHLALAHEDRAHAVIGPSGSNDYWVSIRAPKRNPTGASALARQFPTGGGREAAAGIDQLPQRELESFLRRFERAFREGAKR